MDANQARLYIAQFAKYTAPETTYVETNSGRRINLFSMTDEDALFVAQKFQAMEAEAYKGRRHD